MCRHGNWTNEGDVFDEHYAARQPSLTAVAAASGFPYSQPYKIPRASYVPSQDICNLFLKGVVDKMAEALRLVRDEGQPFYSTRHKQKAEAADTDRWTLILKHVYDVFKHLQVCVRAPSLTCVCLPCGLTGIHLQMVLAQDLPLQQAAYVKQGIIPEEGSLFADQRFNTPLWEAHCKRFVWSCDVLFDMNGVCVCVCLT